VFRCSRASEIEPDVFKEREVRKPGTLRAPVFESTTGDRIRLTVGHRFPNSHELFGIGIRQRLNQHRIDHAENRSVGSNAQRQRDHGNQGEARFLDQHSRAVAQVLQ